MGRRQRTVWCEGYDSPAILTLEDLEAKIAYLELNPVEADLVETGAQYPGVSSFHMIRSGKHIKDVQRIRRFHLEKLEGDVTSPKAQDAILKKLCVKSEEYLRIKIDPNAWTRCFKHVSPAELNERVERRVRDREAELKIVRVKEGRKVKGAGALRREPINRPYTPKKFTPRMWCICHNKRLRISFIRKIKRLRVPRLGNLIPPYLGS